MYLDQPGRALGAGHESAGVTAPGDHVVPRRGRHRHVLRPVHPDGQSWTGDRRDREGRLPADGRSGDHQDVRRGWQQPLQHLGRSRGSRRWPTRRCRRGSPLPTASRSSSSGRCGGRGRRSATWQEAHNSPGETVDGHALGDGRGRDGRTARDRDLRPGGQHVSPRRARSGRPCCSKTAPRRRSKDFVVPGLSRFNIVPASDFPATRRQALRHGRRKYRWPTGADRRRAGDVLQRGRRAMGCRYQRPGNAAALRSDCRRRASARRCRSVDLLTVDLTCPP